MQSFLLHYCNKTSSTWCLHCSWDCRLAYHHGGCLIFHHQKLAETEVHHIIDSKEPILGPTKALFLDQTNVHNEPVTWCFTARLLLLICVLLPWLCQGKTCTFFKLVCDCPAIKHGSLSDNGFQYVSKFYDTNYLCLGTFSSQWP